MEEERGRGERRNCGRQRWWNKQFNNTVIIITPKLLAQHTPKITQVHEEQTRSKHRRRNINRIQQHTKPNKYNKHSQECEHNNIIEKCRVGGEGR